MRRAVCQCVLVRGVSRWVLESGAFQYLSLCIRALMRLDASCCVVVSWCVSMCIGVGVLIRFDAARCVLVVFLDA